MDLLEGLRGRKTTRGFMTPLSLFLLLTSMHKNLPQSRLLDIGMAAENIMLSAYGRELGTCAIALTLLYSDVIEAELKIPGHFETVLMCCSGVSG